MESVRLAVLSTGGEWGRFLIATEPRHLSSVPLYWDGMKWVPERQKAMLYADRASAEQELEKLKTKT